MGFWRTLDDVLGGKTIGQSMDSQKMRKQNEADISSIAGTDPLLGMMLRNSPQDSLRQLGTRYQSEVIAPGHTRDSPGLGGMPSQGLLAPGQDPRLRGGSPGERDPLFGGGTGRFDPLAGTPGYGAPSGGRDPLAGSPGYGASPRDPLASRQFTAPDIGVSNGVGYRHDGKSLTPTGTLPLGPAQKLDAINAFANTALSGRRIDVDESQFGQSHSLNRDQFGESSRHNRAMENLQSAEEARLRASSASRGGGGGGGNLTPNQLMGSIQSKIAQGLPLTSGEDRLYQDSRRSGGGGYLGTFGGYGDEGDVPRPATPALPRPVPSGRGLGSGVAAPPTAPPALPITAPRPVRSGGRTMAADAATARNGLPTAARAQLREGQVTEFNNGQSWTMRGGQPQRVK